MVVNQKQIIKLVTQVNIAAPTKSAQSAMAYLATGNSSEIFDQLQAFIDQSIE